MSRYFLDQVYYFITVPTVNHFSFFNTSEKKKIILDRMEIASEKFNLKELDFGIISNHYHCLAYFPKGEIIPRFLQFINGGSAHALNKMTGNKNLVWDEYFVYVPNNEVVLQKVRGYVIGNPLKHGEVSDFQELENYPFSTYKLNYVREGESQIKEIIQTVIAVDESDFIRMNLTKVS